MAGKNKLTILFPRQPDNRKWIGLWWQKISMITKTHLQIPAACFSFNALQAMRIIQDVEMKLAGNETVLALGIKHSKAPYITKINEMKEMIEDNRPAMEFMIGLVLVDEIIKFK